MPGRNAVPKGHDIIALDSGERSRFHADQIVDRVAPIGKLIVRDVGSENHEGRENARVLEQPKRSVDGGFGNIKADSSHACKKTFGIEQSIAIHDRGKHIGPLRRVPQRL